jgi:hypothetical protein
MSAVRQSTSYGADGVPTFEMWLLQDAPMNFHITCVEALAAELRMRGADILEGPALREYQQLELVVRDCNPLVLTFGEDTSQRAASVHA